jgi:hypothetical protein
MGHLNFKTLLNSKEKYKGFVFNSSKIINNKNECQIEIEILASIFAILNFITLTIITLRQT